MNSNVLNTTDAAKYVGYAPKTMAIMRSKGIGPVFVKPGRVFYFQRDLDEWLEKTRSSSTIQARCKKEILKNKLDASE